MMKILVVVSLVSAAVLAPGLAADAGLAPRQWDLVVAKAVVGPGSDGPYEFQVDCEGFSPTTGTVTVETAHVQIYPPVGGSCTVTETDALGADSISYACTATSGAVCDDGQSFTVPEHIQAAVTITITNTFTLGDTFQESTTTTTAPTTTTTALTTTTAAPAVVATPAFTG